MLDDANPVSIEADNIPLQAFLDKIFAGQELVYSIENKSIIVSRKLLDVSARSHLILEIPPITVRGKIFNEKGEPVIASVIVKGTNCGTTSKHEW